MLNAMKTILAAIDFSNANDGVVQAAVSLAKAYGAELHVLHVLEPEPTYTAYGFTPDVVMWNAALAPAFFGTSVTAPNCPT